MDHLSSPSIAAHLLPCVVGWLGIVRLLIGVVAQENGVQFTKRLQICSYILTYWVAYSFTMDLEVTKSLGLTVLEKHSTNQKRILIF